MFIMSVDSDKLAKSVQQDYRNAAEEYRQTGHSSENRSGLPTMVGVAVALSSLVFVGMIAMQFAAA
jgi:hypothetical protein